MAAVVAIAVVVASGCKPGPSGPSSVAAPDGYRSPYLPVEKRDAGVASDPGLPTDVASPESMAASRKVHPAALERPYPLESHERLAGDAATREILDSMRDPKQGPIVLEKVRRMGQSGIAAVHKALRSQEKNVRMQACLILGNLRKLPRDAIEALREAVLLDPDSDVRATAAKAFVAIREVAAMPELIRSVTEDPSAAVRANAAWALGQLGKTARSVEALRHALHDEDTWVRLRAVTALGRLNAREAVGDLKGLANDPNEMVRERVREVLNRLR